MPTPLASLTSLNVHALRVAEEACSPDEEARASDGRVISRINALRPSNHRPPMPDGLPPDLRLAMTIARRTGVRDEALLRFAEWRFDVLQLEQQEAQKVETLFWMWRTFAASADPEHATLAVPLVRRVLERAWGCTELPEEPLDFAAARKLASRITRRPDLAAEWRAA